MPILKPNTCVLACKMNSVMMSMCYYGCAGWRIRGKARTWRQRIRLSRLAAIQRLGFLAGLRRARRDLVQDNDSGAENDSSTLKQALLDAELGLEKRRQYQLADLPVVDAGSGSALELARYNFTWLHAAATPIGSPMPRPDPRLLRQFYDLCLQIIV